jgi:hypothetical protein
MVANHLLKALHCWTDLGYGDYELRYLRDKEQREVDFVVTESRRPVALIECKLTATALSPSLTYYASSLGDLPTIQLVQTPGVDLRRRGARVVTASRFLAALP